MTGSSTATAPASRWTLVATSLGFAVVQLDVSVVNVAVKPIGAALGGSVAALQWVVNAYTLALAALILTAGALGDRIGARRTFAGGFGLFTLASVACGLAPGLAVLVGARTVQGVGAAVLVPSSLSLLNHAFAPEQRARAVGRWAAGASVALAGGPLVGGVLIGTVGWRAIFFINVPIGLCGLALTLRWAQETSRSPEQDLDLPGQLTGIAFLLVLAGAAIEGGAVGFGAAPVLAAFGLALLLGVAFVAIERRSPTPMTPPELFRSRVFSGATAIGFLVNVAFYGLIFVFSLYFQRTQRHSALATGLAFAPVTVAVLAGNLFAGRAATRVGSRAVLAGGALLMAAGSATLLVLTPTTAYPALAAQLVALGLGLGLVVPVMTASLLGSADRSRSGVASGILNTARQAGSVIGVALFGSLLAGGGVPGGVRDALGVAAVLCLVAAAVGWRVSGAGADAGDR